MLALARRTAKLSSSLEEESVSIATETTRGLLVFRGPPGCLRSSPTCFRWCFAETSISLSESELTMPGMPFKVAEADRGLTGLARAKLDAIGTSFFGAGVSDAKLDFREPSTGRFSISSRAFSSLIN